MLDEVLLLPMLAPRSYTAEDVVEIHCHGGGVCARRVLQALLGAGARLARGGEFSLRAFLNGRLDLSQAESVAQLLGARTVAAADSALAGLQVGGLFVFMRVGLAAYGPCCAVSVHPVQCSCCTTLSVWTQIALGDGCVCPDHHSGQQCNAFCCCA